jgi:hypothetical protein
MVAAAGASMLATPSAEAKIVYTPAHTTIAPHSTLPLDLNHDGVNDFFFSHWFYGHADHLSVIQEVPANGILDNGAALPAGVPIGPRENFANFALLIQQASFSGISSSSTGPWKGAVQRYLGLKFTANGETHFGWARLTVRPGFTAILTGYAYETVPNHPIIAGKTSGTDDTSAVGPNEILSPPDRSATLGMLARGATALAIWRREEEASAPLT